MISRGSWTGILFGTYREFRADRGSVVASGVAFRVMLAIFPGMALLVWAATPLVGPQEAQAVLPKLGGILPESTRRILEQAVASSLQHGPGDGGLGAGLLGSAAPYLGLLFMVWTTNSAMTSLFDALNVIYDKQERRGFLHLTLLTLAFTAGVFVLLALTAGLIVVAPSLLSGVAGAVGFLRWPVLFAVLALALALLYRYGPNREREYWPLVTVGSATAALLLVLSSGLFTWCVATFASLALTYGSLSTVVAFMLWLWVSFLIVLAGAELDAAVEQETGLYGKRRRHGRDVLEPGS